MVVDLSGGMVQIAVVGCERGIDRGQEGAVYVLFGFTSLGCYLGGLAAAADTHSEGYPSSRRGRGGGGCLGAGGEVVE